MSASNSKATTRVKKQMSDVTGLRFGRLIAIEPTDKRQRNSVVWRCQCDCGEIAEVNVTSLKSGGTRSCGCLKREKAAKLGMSKRIDIKGKRYGRLLVLETTDQKQGTATIWKCQCDCGNITYVSIASLNSGETRSCGCLQKEVTGRIGSARRLDLKGKRFGELIALEPTEKRYGSSVVWKCRCDCGRIVEFSCRALSSGGKKSCGLHTDEDIAKVQA